MTNAVPGSTGPDVEASNERLRAVVDTWFPRFLANGLDYLDVRRTLVEIHGWEDWASRWVETGERYERLGLDALEAGHRRSAAAHLVRAALTFHFGQFALTQGPVARAEIHARQVAVYAKAAPLLRPPAVRVEVGGDGGIVGYLRRPQGSDRSPLVILVPGIDSTKEQFTTYEPHFLERGVATLAIEGPGQGERWSRSPFRHDEYLAAFDAVLAFARGLDGVDRDRIAVLGTSFGGYLAVRCAASAGGVSAIVDIAGPFDLEDFASLQPVVRESFARFLGAADEGDAARLVASVDLRDVAGDVTVPVLVVHGERDRVIPVSHGHRIAEALGDRATLWLFAEGDHSCNNLHTTVRPDVADWVADRLRAAA